MFYLSPARPFVALLLRVVSGAFAPETTWIPGALVSQTRKGYLQLSSSQPASKIELRKLSVLDRIVNCAAASRIFAADFRDWAREAKSDWIVHLHGKPCLGTQNPENGVDSEPGLDRSDLIISFRGQESQVKNIAKAWGMELTSLHQRLGSEIVDAEVYQLAPYQSKRHADHFVFRAFVDEAVSFSNDLEAWIGAFVGRDMRRKLKRATERGFEILKGGNKDLARFHETLLVPFSRYFHGEDAHIPSIKALQQLLLKGELLLARDSSGNELGGIVVMKSRASGVRFLRTGIALGVLNEPKLRDDLTAFLYSTFVSWAIAMGARKGSFGLSPAAATDGLVYFKSRWGSNPVSANRCPRFGLVVKTPCCTQWLTKRKLFVLSDHEIVAFGDSHKS